MAEFTTVVAVDDAHVAELQLVWPTWKRNRAEILQRPLLIVADAARSRSSWKRQLAFVDHPDVRLETWSMEAIGQREKMLTSLVHGPARWVETPWYLKLDTDAVAVAPGRWIDETWFRPDRRNRTPVFVASPWNYTKPADAIERLDRWADSVPALRRHNRLDLVAEQGASRIVHPRVISWCFFGDTRWTSEMWDLCDGRLPIPSQDTFLWFCAERGRRFYRRVFMKERGWEHVTNRKLLTRLCGDALRVGN